MAEITAAMFGNSPALPSPPSSSESPAPDADTGEYEVDAILNHRNVVPGELSGEYLVKWKIDASQTWEPSVPPPPPTPHASPPNTPVSTPHTAGNTSRTSRHSRITSPPSPPKTPFYFLSGIFYFLKLQNITSPRPDKTGFSLQKHPHTLRLRRKPSPPALPQPRPDPRASRTRRPPISLFSLLYPPIPPANYSSGSNTQKNKKTGLCRGLSLAPLPVCFCL